MIYIKKLLFLLLIITLIPCRIIKTSNNLPLLVNKDHPLPKEYKPKNLILVPSFYTVRDTYLDIECFHSFQKLKEESTYPYLIYSGYRSYEYQEKIYTGDPYQAKPGESEHQTGLAIDITIDGIGLNKALGDTIYGIWLEDNCHKFGFIIRYPKNKEKITGYLYEPWHIRYVGSDIACQIKQNNLTLEEYINLNK